jgi:hypothetical protein
MCAVIKGPSAGKFHGPANSWQGNQGKGIKPIDRQFDSLAFIPLPAKCQLFLARAETLAQVSARQRAP